MTTQFPIDLVLTWCDDADPIWRAKRHAYDTSTLAADDAGECRFRSNDELRYMLRSVEENAPWINHIYIITDHQRPSWLNTSNPRLSLVCHEEILPPECLPLFNSSAIETAIANIPGLSEHFIYGNDDTFLARVVHPEDFFPRPGHAIHRMSPQNLRKSRGSYQTRVRRSQEEIERRFGVKIRQAPHHNIDAYLKSDFQACAEYYRPKVEATLKHRFRDASDFHLRSLVGMYMVQMGHADLEVYSRYADCHDWRERLRCFLTGRYKVNSKCFPLCQSADFDKLMEKYNPRFLALNDDSRTTDDDRRRELAFMQRRWPRPSQFELQGK